jgi:phospholipid/cholesterol/gamma-HCH transport system substrate-binding protein
MPPKHKIKASEMKVGIFVVIALLLLSALILQQSWGIKWFSKSVKAMTYLPDVGGLKSGAPVWLAGLEIGRVRKVTIIPPEVYPGNAAIYRRIEELNKAIIAIDPKLPKAKDAAADLLDQIRNIKSDIRLVEVQLDIQPQFLSRIGKDSEVSIESRGLIGDSFIDITPGVYGGLPNKRGGYYVIDSIQHAGFREIMTGANDVIANFGVLSEQVKNLMVKINPGKVGSNVSDALQDIQRTVRAAEKTFNQATFLIDDLHAGQGTFGKIVSDPELYKRMTESLEKLNAIADKIQNGSGTIPKLINDPTLYDTANQTLKKAEKVIERIEKGEGTFGKLSQDAALYEKTRVAFEKFAALAEQLDQGKGTMGKLLKDPGLYNNLDQSTAEISKLLYDLRQDPKKYLTIRFRIF